MHWKTLLVPHDFSTAAERAFAQASDLAALAGGRVVLLHVSPIPHGLRADSRILPDDGDGSTLVRIDEYMTSAAKKKLADLARERCPSAHLHALASEGDPADVILQQADELAADVIVMGTHGRSGVRRLLLGSVAERVLRRARVPVLVVRDTHADEKHLHEEDAVAAEGLG